MVRNSTVRHAIVFQADLWAALKSLIPDLPQEVELDAVGLQAGVILGSRTDPKLVAFQASWEVSSYSGPPPKMEE